MRRTGWRATLLTAGALGLASGGCAHFIDEITSREFKVKNLFVSPDPIVVLRESQDGDARAKAMQNLDEPAAHGKPELQDEVMQYLTDAATTDPRPLCRLAAIDALGRFNDPRCADVLLRAYQTASEFTTDIANPIRCEAMTALGKKNSPEGLALLTQVATTPRAATRNSDVKLASFDGGAELDRLLGSYDPDSQAARDARLAAVRALGATKNPQVIPTLLPLLSEKDVALRDRAHEALQNITGKKNVAPNPEAWRAALGS